MNVKLVTTGEEIREACRVLLQLRPQYTLASLINAVTAQMQQDYQLAGCSENGTFLGAMGFVMGHKLAWKKHIYIDDLVVTTEQRSRGAGAALLEWISEYAREHECEQIHLDSGVQRYDAHRFYLNHGFRIASHHFSRTDLKKE